MKIARVFPTKTSMSPQDQDAYFGLPELFMPEYDEVHISVTFTWDIEKAKWLKKQWEHIAPVKIGGVAIDGEPKNGFKAGIYLRNGITITSRGCPNKCPWCLVQSRLIELDEISPGNNIQDNNILACSQKHLDKVFSMLKAQKKVEFGGGLESSKITDKIIDDLRGLNIYQVFLAYDHANRFNDLKIAVEKLKKYFTRNQLRCYVLIGFKNDTIKKAEQRLIEAYELGLLPFAMLYRNKEGDYPHPETEWRRFQRKWCRPASINSYAKNGFKNPPTP